MACRFWIRANEIGAFITVDRETGAILIAAQKTDGTFAEETISELDEAIACEEYVAIVKRILMDDQRRKTDLHRRETAV